MYLLTQLLISDAVQNPKKNVKLKKFLNAENFSATEIVQTKVQKILIERNSWLF